MAIPRFGQEVLVTFLEGAPDRPVITGRVFNSRNPVPYPLPEHKTRTVFKSMSTPGREGELRGFNELRIEDKKGREEIYAHAIQANLHAFVYLMRDIPEGGMNMPDNSAIRNFRKLASSDLTAAFTDARHGGLHIDAIVAVDATPQMLEDYFSWKGADAFHPVLQDTPYASLWATMPYLSRIGAGSRLETHLLAEHSAWGFFAVTAASEQTHCGYWRSLCEVLLPSGKKSFFRFQDPGALEKMLPTFSDQELGWFLGPAARLFIPIRNHDGERAWLDVPSPVLSGRTERELADLYRLAKGRPWWEVREEHLGGLLKENRAALVYNLSQDLKENSPVTAALTAEHYGSLDAAVG